MDDNLEIILRQRQNAGQCIICGVKISIENKEDYLIFEHSVVGIVEICKSHIKSSEETKVNQD